jgi:Patatin-like phospholipase
VSGEADTARDCPRAPAEIADVRNLAGLALSGGGIRSASFNLGFLQGLAAKQVLHRFDYLSTVSGGGFVGGWWSAWLSRRQRAIGDVFPPPEELELQRRAATAVLIAKDAEAAPAEALPDGSLSAKRNDPIHFVRLFSNYLTPKTGIMSPDTWRLIAYFIRSLLFTWLALVPILFAVVLLAQSIYLFKEDTRTAFLCGGAAVVAEHCSTGAAAGTDAGAPPASGGSFISPGDARLAFLKNPVVAVLAIYATLVVLWLVETAASQSLAIAAFVGLGAVIWLVSRSNGGSAPLSAASWSALIATLVTLILFIVQSFVKRQSDPGSGAPPIPATAADRRTWLTQQQERVLKFATFSGLLLFAAAFANDLAGFIFGGIEAGLTAELKKAGGWGALLLTGVSGLYTLIKQAPSTTGQPGSAPSLVGKILMLIAPPLVVAALLLGLAVASHHLLLCIERAPAGFLGTLARAAICLAVIEVFLAIYESCNDPEDLASTRGVSWRSFVPLIFLKAIGMATPVDDSRPWYQVFSARGWARAAAAGCILLVLGSRFDFSPSSLWNSMMTVSVTSVALGILAAAALLSLSSRRWKVSLRSARPVALMTAASLTATLCLLANSGVLPDVGVAALLWVAILIGGVIALGWLADPNLISLHGFYKARISRAYMGASNSGRDNEDITDAAPGDDVAMKEVWNHDIGGPYHLINASLNLVGGSDLATSQRLAENFVMSRYHCGSARAGYRCTAEYMSGQLSLATAVAISGAAVSPTMGSQTPSAALTLLLSLFNVRLGFWAPTPSGKRWYEGHARLWPFYLLRETLANTGNIGTYCYLTDGGHFDNTALYALVERGCRLIVVCDCGADPTPSFGDIGTAIRRCRIDFGAEIDLQIDDFVTEPNLQGVGRVHVGYGSITYQPEHLRLLGLDEQTERVGRIIWVKPTVTAWSAADVRQYRKAHSDFPQQATSDQWYDESQFESYRRLGYESALQAFADAFGQHATP